MHAIHVGGRYARPNPVFQQLICPDCHAVIMIEIPPGYRTANKATSKAWADHVTQEHWGETYRRRRYRIYAVGAPTASPEALREAQRRAEARQAPRAK